jgi:hypothetical protein
MKKMLSLIALGLALTGGLAQAQEKAQEKAKTPQQNKMAMCNKEATGKTGDDRKAFMKTCLSAGKSDASQRRLAQRPQALRVRQPSA